VKIRQLRLATRMNDAIVLDLNDAGRSVNIRRVKISSSVYSIVEEIRKNTKENSKHILSRCAEIKLGLR
jgi:hypothetical protein